MDRLRLINDYHNIQKIGIPVLVLDTTKTYTVLNQLVPVQIPRDLIKNNEICININKLAVRDLLFKDEYMSLKTCFEPDNKVYCLQIPYKAIKEVIDGTNT